MAKFPGHVITEEVLASLVGDAFAQSHIPLNILSGFKKSGIYPFNPGEVSDRKIAPSRALTKPTPQTPTFSPAQVAQFEARYEEGYDVQDNTYLEWKSMYHPSPESVSSAATSKTTSVTSSVSVGTGASSSKSLPSSEEVLAELLVLPQPLAPKTSRRKKAVNEKAKEITEDSFLEEMKEKTQAAAHAQQLKEQRKLEREQRKLEREQRARVRKEEKERKKQEWQEREKEKERRAKQPKRIQRQRRATKHAASPVDTSELVSLFADLDVEDNG